MVVPEHWELVSSAYGGKYIRLLVMSIGESLCQEVFPRNSQIHIYYTKHLSSIHGIKSVR